MQLFQGAHSIPGFSPAWGLPDPSLCELPASDDVFSAFGILQVYGSPRT